MTNRESLRAPPHALSPLDRRRRHMPAAESSPVPCPACTTPLDAITAAGPDLDEYTFGVTTPAYRCPHCGAVLDRVTPLVAFGPGWHWELDRPWLADDCGGPTCTTPCTRPGDPAPRRPHGPAGTVPAGPLRSHSREEVSWPLKGPTRTGHWSWPTGSG